MVDGDHGTGHLQDIHQQDGAENNTDGFESAQESSNGPGRDLFDSHSPDSGRDDCRQDPCQRQGSLSRPAKKDHQDNCRENRDRCNQSIHKCVLLFVFLLHDNILRHIYLFFNICVLKKFKNIRRDFVQSAKNEQDSCISSGICICGTHVVR